MVLIGELKYEAEADALIANRRKQYQAMAEAKASEKKN
jgi:hypothetical protein